MKIFTIGVDRTTIALLQAQGILAEVGEDIASPEDVNECLNEEHDAVVIDLSVTRWSVYIARYIRSKYPLPIIGISNGVTSMGWPDERATWLENGGDDYLRAPCNPRELGASLRSLIGRLKNVLTDFREYRYGEVTLRIDLGTQRVTVNGQAVLLTAKERCMVTTLALKNGHTVSKEKFMSDLYSQRDEPEIKIIDVFICKVRAKLKTVHPDAALFIETVWGIGYRLVSPDVAVAVPAKVA